MRFLIVVFLFVLAYGEAKRIIGGSNASTGEFPHQLSLRIGTFHICGAVLIALNKAITAAHCIETSALSSDYDFDIRAGTLLNAYTWSCPSPSANCQDRPVSTFTRHPSYNTGPGTFPNDIGTLHFAALTSNPEVKIISLDKGASSLSSCQISGWGLTVTGGLGLLAINLKKAAVTIMTRAECESHWGSTINDGHICVWGDGQRGACNGDSGGPLTCSSGSSLVVAGVTSWGNSGCYPSRPSVYTRVSHFYDWILAN